MKLRSLLATGALALSLAGPAAAQDATITNPNPPYPVVVLNVITYPYHNNTSMGGWTRWESFPATSDGMASCVAAAKTWLSYYGVTQDAEVSCVGYGTPQVFEEAASNPPPASW